MSELDAFDLPEVAAADASDAEVAAAAHARLMAERRAWRLARSGEFALELAMLPGRRWLGSSASQLSLQSPVSAAQAIEDAVFAVWDLARQVPPAGREQVYSVGGDAGRIVVAHTDNASVVARSGGPFLIIVDSLGKMAWRIDTDEIWADDLALIVRELFEVSQGRPAVDESAIPPMPRLPWHRD